MKLRGWKLVSPWPFVIHSSGQLSICRRNVVHMSTLIGRCSKNIFLSFGKLYNFTTSTASCVHVLAMLNLIPDMSWVFFTPTSYIQCDTKIIPESWFSNLSLYVAVILCYRELSLFIYTLTKLVFYRQYTVDLWYHTWIRLVNTCNHNLKSDKYNQIRSCCNCRARCVQNYLPNLAFFIFYFFQNALYNTEKDFTKIHLHDWQVY